MPTEIVAILVPVVMFIAIAVVLCVYFHMRHRTNEAVQKTVRTAIEQGQQLTPEILERLGQSPRHGASGSRHSDLRRGVILISVGLGIAVFVALVHAEGLAGPAFGIGALPFLIGAAYLGLWRFGHRNRNGSG